ncbi:RNA polymerase subunit sigma [Myxococcus stipitatus]|uniref:RNA polymerase subunit sigma n=1 Tax=Myxococcus stipitatus TaxID=83455 RepID=UPI003145563C
MADTVDPKYLDKRTAERYLRSGQLDEKALERHLKGLPDVADKATPVETLMVDDVEDYDDEDDDEDMDDEDESDDEVSNDEADLEAAASAADIPDTSDASGSSNEGGESNTP